MYDYLNFWLVFAEFGVPDLGGDVSNLGEFQLAEMYQ